MNVKCEKSNKKYHSNDYYGTFKFKKTGVFWHTRPNIEIYTYGMW